jgi:hypothetical protein
LFLLLLFLLLFRFIQFWVKFGESGFPKLQNIWTKQIDLHCTESIRSELNNTNKARLNSASGKNSSRWLTTLPTCPELQMSDAIFSIAVRHHLGCPLPAPIRCLCGQQVTETNHFHTCIKVRCRGANFRHNLIVSRYASACRRAGYSVTVEPHSYSDDPVGNGPNARAKALRPDLTVAGFNTVTMLDVSVTHPSAQSYVVAAAAKHGAAALLREQSKRAKYQAFARRNGCAFLPLVVETYGTFGKDATDFHRKLSEDALIHSGADYKQFYDHLLSSLSVGLQMGNAHLIMTCANLSNARRMGMSQPPEPRIPSRQASHFDAREDDYENENANGQEQNVDGQEQLAAAEDVRFVVNV